MSMRPGAGSGHVPVQGETRRSHQSGSTAVIHSAAWLARSIENIFRTQVREDMPV